jgi:hypothetical protein
MNIAAEREMPLRPLLGEPEDEHETLDMVRYWRAIARNKWRILALVIAVGILAQLFAAGLPPVYRATATVLVEASKPKPGAQPPAFYEKWLPRGLAGDGAGAGATATPDQVERRVNAPILGVVLNRLDVLRGEYSGYGRRYYSKKYSYGYSPKKG